MKKLKTWFFVLLFFVCINFYAMPFSFVQNRFTRAAPIIGMVLNVDFEGKNFQFNFGEIISKISISERQKEITQTPEKRLQTYKLVKNFTPTQFDAILYCYPEIGFIFDKLSSCFNVDATNADVNVVKNSCKIEFIEGKRGRFIDKQNFGSEFEKQVLLGKTKIALNLVSKEFEYEDDLKQNMKEKGCFSTNFSSSNEARKNNIRVALSSFDGLVLEDGEILSFNTTTGVRNEQTGYKPAKIISGGTFTEGYGGGVCQVSTTLYNACLLSGLEILEVHNHSLPVSYIEPSFDAMVNVGSSDLIVRNNSGGKLIFTTSSKNDICKVKIFGTKNKYKVTRFSEKTQILPAEPDTVVYDYLKFADDLEVGEEKRISYPKDGYCSNGYLNYYSENGELVETKLIRSNKYKPTKGIIVRREK